MISFDDFINKWNGRGIDFDGFYGDQCMDLMHQYIVEVIGLVDGRILAAPAAKDVYLNFNNIFGKEYFDKIDNTPTGVPNKGDIVFWGTGLGPFGHVGIFRDGNVNSFNSFDQNFPIGTKCHIQNHNYTGVLGWLRAKPTAVPTPVINDQTKYDFGGNIGIIELGTARSIMNDRQKEIDSLKDKINKAKAALQ